VKDTAGTLPKSTALAYGSSFQLLVDFCEKTLGIFGDSTDKRLSFPQPNDVSSFKTLQMTTHQEDYPCKAREKKQFVIAG